MLSSSYVEHLSVIWAIHQTAGRGQQDNKWFSESGKNLTFSVLLRFDSFKLSKQFNLNKLIGIAVKEALKKYFPYIQIKWPNDIMADNSKIAGILIENSVKGENIKHSIVGIGININQTEFDEKIGNVGSLKTLTGKEFDVQDVLLKVLKSIEDKLQLLKSISTEEIHQLYMDELYEKDNWNWFRLPDNQTFEAKIVNVSPEGKLVLQNRNNDLQYFGVQEIKIDKVL